jgi:hypothetical protein
MILSGYYSGTFTKPGKTFASLIADKNKLRYGFYAVAIAALVIRWCIVPDLRWRSAI